MRMKNFVALCTVGAEKILGNEIKKLGYTLSGNAPGRVFFSGDDEALYRANLCLQTCDRMYLQAGNFSCEDFDSLFDGVYTIDWQNYFKKNARIVVDKVRVFRSSLNSEHTIQSMVHKAIYKKLGDKWKMQTLPETGAEVCVRVYLEKNVARILIDTSGDALHKRGYRTHGGSAPLRETLAAILLHEMMWRRRTPLADPFCGSGTIATEALLFAHNIAPGFGRKFAFENFAFYNEKQFLEIKKNEAQKIRCDVQVRIHASDIEKSAIENAKINAEHACVIGGRALQMIGSDAKIERPEFEVCDFADLQLHDEDGLFVCNPPYGERLGDENEANALYEKMNVLWEKFPSWKFAVITTHKNFQKHFSHFADELKKLKEGNLDRYVFLYRNRNENLKK